MNLLVDIFGNDVIPVSNGKSQTADSSELASAQPVSSAITSTAVADVRDDACYALIEQIRRDKFGVDVAMDDHVMRLFQSHKEIIGRSLDRLSKDLYRSITAFILS